MIEVPVHSLPPRARLLGALSAGAFALGARTTWAQTRPTAPSDDAPRVQDAIKEPPPDPPTTETAPAEPPKPPPTAEVATPTTAPAPPAFERSLKAEYYVIPIGGFQHQSQAVPRDQYVYGVISARFGMLVTARPFEQWTAIGHVGFDASYIRRGISGALTAVDARDGADLVLTSVPVEEITVAYQPAKFVAFKLGHQRLPFSLAQSVIIVGQMFPSRPGPSAAFNNGADDGLRVNLSALDNRLTGALGVFNGGSLGLRAPGTTSVGPTFAAFLAAQPLGEMPATESDFERGRFRFGVGFGGLMRDGQLYDSTGYGTTGYRDLRASATIRASYRGAFVQAEYLRRVQTDDLSLRPSKAVGAYATASYFFPVSSVALAPIARVGHFELGEETAGRTATDLAAGLSFFPVGNAPEALRVITHYAYEIRKPFRETSHGVVASVQLRF